MQIILIQDVPHLGSLGDEVHVKDGYARNFLLPRGLAFQSGSKKFREVDHHRRRLEQLRATAIENAKTESEKVAELELVVKAKAGANGKLFGSVTNRDIQAVLAGLGYTLDRRAIQLQVPIKSVGAFTVSVKLHTDVKVDVNVRVVPDTESADAGPGEEGAEALEGKDAAEGAGENAETSENTETGETAAAEGAARPGGDDAPEGDAAGATAVDAAGESADGGGTPDDGADSAGGEASENTAENSAN